jgi:hypothetical protein
VDEFAIDVVAVPVGHEPGSIDDGDAGEPFGHS